MLIARCSEITTVQEAGCICAFSAFFSVSRSVARERVGPQRTGERVARMRARLHAREVVRNRCAWSSSGIT
jgi:hypothetical protein